MQSESEGFNSNKALILNENDKLISSESLTVVIMNRFLLGIAKNLHSKRPAR